MNQGQREHVLRIQSRSPPFLRTSRFWGSAFPICGQSTVHGGPLTTTIVIAGFSARGRRFVVASVLSVSLIVLWVQKGIRVRTFQSLSGRLYSRRISPRRSRMNSFYAVTSQMDSHGAGSQLGDAVLAWLFPIVSV